MKQSSVLINTCAAVTDTDVGIDFVFKRNDVRFAARSAEAYKNSALSALFKNPR